MRNRAFTLIELLVVIGIIAILASIALPAYRGVQERARGVQEANNLRQIGIGFVGYLNDHDDTMFNTLSGASVTSGSSCWANMLGPGGTANYIQDNHVFQSPFDTRAYSGSNLSFGINKNVISPTAANGASSTSVTSVSNYSSSSSLLILAPNGTLNGSNLTFSDTLTSSTPINPPGGALVGTMGHNTLLNVLYGDWHVASINTSTLKGTTSAGPLWSPQPTSPN